MDNDVDYTLLPTDFMEFWLPLSQTQEVVTRLRNYFDTEGLDATGAYAFEIYAAKRSPFWMSPAYGNDMVRVDFLWFKGNTGNPVVDYFPQFWQLLRDMGFRLHWGKYLLEDHPYLQAQYPQWQAFMQVRHTLDPQQCLSATTGGGIWGSLPAELRPAVLP
jgi:D-arabinono-1,4-lactone oxidase